MNLISVFMVFNCDANKHRLELSFIKAFNKFYTSFASFVDFTEKKV